MESQHIHNHEAPKFSWSEITCGEACWSAKEEICKCSCGGKNHGIWLKGGKPEYRTAKHNGMTYKLIAAGSLADLKKTQVIELDKYGIYRCYDYCHDGNYSHQTYRDYYRCRGDKDTLHFPVICKLATLDQCNKWHELSAFKGIDSYQRVQLLPALLWEVIEKPKPVIHICGL